ncbi:MAG: DMT family transporter, partial [Gammaproteobacteria bacterium]|nr:DMT family transporter [Gammaproteobacteria bacterium]NIR99053.1 DMT family transporter [Gammaproteobacteria bacterium]NIT64679.1 DMT family transporter [Gammaproteobacteria bacterium]NIV21640.1 EamA family transporter [Gammaproteobacteria bacterium]NIY33259.1 EamA family transporter [Gammaproteobacteria bacterium]
AFFRNFLALLLLLGWHRSRFFGYFRTAHLKLHLLRGGLNVVAMLMFFTAVLITPLADVAALGFTAPLFASLLAIVVLRERLRWHRLLVIAFGFVGAVVILRPGFAAVGQGPVLLLMSAALWSVTMLVIKMIARTDSSVTITVYMGSVMAPLSLLAALWFWQWPTLEQLGWFVVISALGTLGQVSLAQSFRIAEVTAVLPLDFMKLVWGSLLGFFIFA